MTASFPKAGPPGATGPPGPQGPAGSGGGSGGVGTFTFHQASAAVTWTISHGLGAEPSVYTADLGGVEVIGDVTYPDDNTVVVTFGSPQAGVAYLN